MIPLYFPENKLEYIPAVVTCVLFMIGAWLTWRIFVKASRREQQRFDKLEQELKKKNPPSVLK